MARHERSSGTRVLLIGVFAGLLFAAAGVGAFVAMRSSTGSSAAPPGTTVQTVQAVQMTTESVPTSPAAPAATASVSEEARVARQLARIVEFSIEGRAAVRSGRYEEAIANRRQVLLRLQRLTGGSARLQRARRTFERAMEASLESDEAYAVGGDATSSDALATRLKRLFVSQFNPIARRHGLPIFDADEI